ncbi:hypothetical protein DSM112329_04107 [Paraconexibacter sp. AEG42_29]|uniref:SMP-30/Gluconolactonase/LRE-like region domain-containing protein n=1 Tax=Paraconexibacter sp. AEG42_29 TaxID=2997339 RepID=A0AAU7AZP8_9ACTN
MPVLTHRPRRRGVALAGVLAGLVGALVAAPSASAVPDCATPLPAVVPVLAGQGSLESVIVDGGGRLFYTDTTAKALMRLDEPGAAPVVVRAGIEAPGGLAFDADGRHLFVGQGDSLAGGLTGNLAPAASLLRVDVDSGQATVFATGLRMANGLVRAADGTLYASTDLGTSLDRIAPDGGLRRDWASVISGNGLAIDRAQRSLFVNQTFVPAQISRIDLADPRRVSTYFRAPADLAAGLDGMAIDPADRLVVAANLTGEVWRIDTDGTGCALGRGLVSTSAVAYGQGARGFSAGRLFAVGFDGKVVEVPGGRLAPQAAPPAAVPGPAVRPIRAPRLTLQPAAARVRGGFVAFVPRLTRGGAKGRRVAATLRIGGRTLRTGRPVRLRVGPGATRLTVRFTVAGDGYQRTIRLLRR